MRLYKLTDENGQTRNATQWGPGVTHTASGKGELCGPGWLHAYTDPLLAVLLNPIHANIARPRLWECEGVVRQTDSGLKVGCTSLTTEREIPLPNVTTEQRVRFAIRVGLVVYPNVAFITWATKWLFGEDRTEAAAWAAAWAAWAVWAAAAAAPVASAAAAAAVAAEAAAASAGSSASPSAAAAAAVAAEAAAAAAARAAWAAATAAAEAAAAARAAPKELPLAELACWAVSDEPLPEVTET